MQKQVLSEQKTDVVLQRIIHNIVLGASRPTLDYGSLFST
jgi:hypothetical protein